MDLASWERRLLPPRVRRSVRTARALWATGALRKPAELVDRWRHRQPFQRLQKALFYHRYAAALLLGHELGLYDLLAAGPRGAAAVAEACAIHPRAAEAMLRILEAEGLLERTGEGYRLSAFGRLYLVRGGGLSMADTLDLLAAQAAAFAELPGGMASGAVPAALDIFSPDGRYQAFLDAVNGFLHFAAADLLAAIALPEIESFICGSMGVSFSALLRARSRGFAAATAWPTTGWPAATATRATRPPTAGATRRSTWCS
jgi:hypothetical protein